MSLLDSIRRVLGQRGMTVQVVIRELIMPAQVRPNGSRKALRQAAVDSISEALAPYVDPYSEHRRPSTCRAHPIVVPQADGLVSEVELPSLLIGRGGCLGSLSMRDTWAESATAKTMTSY